ncbi:MAG: biopolymer transporter ExbD [Gemmobacter sp.]|jgi:biopolymer transport protein ExbD|nr:biopolymer transporter ExbD [Gemmobacter sp.]
MVGQLPPGPDDDPVEAHEINVTPFIDVMLVLLIIFMVAAPLSTSDVPLTLPSTSTPPAQRPEEPVVLSLQRDLTLSLGGEAIPRAALAAQLTARARPEDRIYLRADAAVPYGALMAVMNLLREAGFVQVALVAQEDTGP